MISNNERNKTSLARLVRSLSAAEKRQFKLYCKMRSGRQDFLRLFNVIDRQRPHSSTDLESAFALACPGKSFENTAQYLFKVLTDMLVQLRSRNDKWFQQHFSLMKAKLLFDRSLTDEGYSELRKAKKIAEEVQDHQIHYVACRQELNHLSEISFPGISEKELIQLQMKAKNSLRISRQVQEHYSLYELLKYRLVHLGKSLSDEDKKKLNDLLISELSLITRGGQSGFESQKLHLLFQSFFFTDIGDYRSSLKIFKRLNQLFEDNRQTWTLPPYDYLSSLEGILDSLRTIRYYDEMDYYIKKVEHLAGEKHTEHFQVIAAQIAGASRLNVLISQGKLEQARAFIAALDPTLIRKPKIVDNERMAELLFYVGLVFFCRGGLKTAHRHIQLALETARQRSSLYKASRLIYVLLHYEMDDSEFLDYEIRSYKRAARKKGPLLKIEQLIFKIIKFDPRRNSKAKNRRFWKIIQPQLDELEKDKYEKQVLKYYDIGTLVQDKFFRSFAGPGAA